MLFVFAFVLWYFGSASPIIVYVFENADYIAICVRAFASIAFGYTRRFVCVRV